MMVVVGGLGCNMRCMIRWIDGISEELEDFYLSLRRELSTISFFTSSLLGYRLYTFNCTTY